jgi:hypothetical protein
MNPINVLEVGCTRFANLQAEAARNRAAFSWDDFAIISAPAGFPNEDGEPRTINIPLSLYALPIEVPAWAEGELSPTPKQNPGIRCNRLFYREVSQSLVHKFSDLEFSKAAAGVGGITHSATSSMLAIQGQPPWVTFAMSPYLAYQLGQLGRPRWERYCERKAFKWDIGDTDHLAVFLTKAMLGSFDLFCAHADLFVIPPGGMSGIDNRRVYYEIHNYIKYADKVDYSRPKKEMIEDIIANLQYKKEDTGRLKWDEAIEAIKKLIIRTMSEYDGKSSKLREIEGYEIQDPRFLSLIESIQKTLPIRVTCKGSKFPLLAHWGNNEFTCPPFVDLLIRWGTFDEKLARPSDLRTYLEANAWGLVTGKHPDKNAVHFVRELLQIWGPGSILVSGGEAQHMEHLRMAKVGWPHILSSVNSHRSAKPYITIGSFGDLGFSVRDLDTVKASHFIVPPEHMHLLCDHDGNFLPYSTVCEVLRKEYDDFSRDTTELKDFVANELPKASNPVLQQAFEPALAMRFDIKKCYGFELDNDGFYRQMAEDGTEGNPLPSVSFHCGPEKYTMLALPSTQECPADKAVTEVAAHAVNNGYSDYGKTCWLRTRGLLSDKDEVHAKKWNPKEDLGNKQYQDWLDWCFEVAREDAGSNLNSYDGKYEIHHVDSLHFAAVTWRES